MRVNLGLEAEVVVPITKNYSMTDHSEQSHSGNFCRETWFADHSSVTDEHRSLKRISLEEKIKKESYVRLLSHWKTVRMRP